MYPINFQESNVVYGKEQPEYLPLPAHRDEQGIATTCWALTDDELARVLETRCIFIQQYTFNVALQPLRVIVEKPF